MNCENVKKELELMYDGKKPSAKALAHIKDCASCKAEYNYMLKITCVVKNDVKVPHNFNKAVWNKIGEPAPFSIADIFRPAFMLAGAAAAALVVFMVVSTGNGSFKNKSEFVSKPQIVKEKIAKKNTIPEKFIKQEPVTQDEAVPVVAQNSVNPDTAVQKTNDSVSTGNMAVLVTSNGADKEYTVKNENDGNNMSVVSVSKNPVEMEAPFIVKNNIIKPLSGQGMTIIYKVEASCDVLIRIYNRKGEPVKTLVRTLQGRGVYTEVWKGEDDKNMAVGDGIYVVHIKTCLTEQKIKAIVVK